jgi:hypothetical protein
MTTTRANMDPKESDSTKKPEDKKNDGLIDTTDTAPKEVTKDANESEKGAKLTKEELLEKTKAKVNTQDAEKVEEGFAYVHIPYSGADTAYPIEKREVDGQSLHVLPVIVNGKEYLIATNKQVKVPKEVKEVVENMNHRGTKANSNEPTLLQ